MQETQAQSLGWEDPPEEGIATTPVLLPGETHGQRSLAGYSPWGHRESDTTEETLVRMPSNRIITVFKGSFSFFSYSSIHFT